eukprot:jgi/Mesvir1/12618/Mv09317-RA.1
MAQNIQIAITSDEMWDSEIRKTTGFLQVIDVHQAWCGPCKAIQATFRRIFFDNNDRPLKFYTAESDKLAALEPYRGKCEPLFLIYTVMASISFTCFAHHIHEPVKRDVCPVEAQMWRWCLLCISGYGRLCRMKSGFVPD